jgi:hypothetical protein
MKTKVPFYAVCSFVGSLALLSAEPPVLINSHLEPFRPLLQKTWQGTFKNSKPDRPTIDVMRWERALNGEAVRVLHSINDGAYGGETLIVWDAKRQCVAYYYFTTAGFMTRGTMTVEDGKIISHEIVSGSSGGVKEVKGTSQLLPDGTFQVKTEHLENSQWQPGHEVTYREEPSATVRFK